MDKLILFDWGNIVESHSIGYNGWVSWDDLFKRCGYTGNERAFHLIGKYNLINIKTEEEFKSVYEQMKIDFNFNKDFDFFVKSYKEIFSNINYFKDVADYEISLKNRCKIGILSDLIIYDKERLDKQVGLDNYDYVFLSYEYGTNKYHIEYFEQIQKELPFEPSNILFVDDRQDNCEKAKSIGWNVCQATGLELDKIKDACEEFLSR